MNPPWLLPILVVLSALLNTLGQNLLKLGSGQTPLNLYLLGGLVTYGLSTVVYVVVLGKLNLSMVYPTVIGLTIITTTFCGAFFLKEQVTVTHWIGIGLVLSGVFAIAFGKSAFS